jgi:hypothetical protein
MQQEVWWRPGGRSPFSLDPGKPKGPQIASAALQMAVIFGGPALAIIAIDRYPLLIEDRTLYLGGLSSIAFFFAVSFAFFTKRNLPRGIPLAAEIPFRAGWALATTALLLGIALVANGYGTPLAGRDAAVVAKHQTRERDPARRVYYLALRAWPDSPSIVELGAPREVYASLVVPVTAIGTPEAALEGMPDAATVRLILGQGRFGWEWLKTIERAQRR